MNTVRRMLFALAVGALLPAAALQAQGSPRGAGAGGAGGAAAGVARGGGAGGAEPVPGSYEQHLMNEEYAIKVGAGAGHVCAAGEQLASLGVGIFHCQGGDCVVSGIFAGMRGIAYRAGLPISLTAARPTPAVAAEMAAAVAAVWTVNGNTRGNFEVAAQEGRLTITDGIATYIQSDGSTRVIDLSVGGSGVVTPAPRRDPTNWSFTVEPSLWEASGPAAGKVQDGDFLVGVNGVPITSRAAAGVLGNLVPGRPVTLMLRRNGAVVSSEIFPVAACMNFVVSAGPNDLPPVLTRDATGKAVRVTPRPAPIRVNVP